MQNTVVCNCISRNCECCDFFCLEYLNMMAVLTGFQKRSKKKTKFVMKGFCFVMSVIDLSRPNTGKDDDDDDDDT